MKMNYIKTIKMIRKYAKKMNKTVKQNGKKKNKSMNAVQRQTPFYSVFATLEVKNRQNSGFLMLGNDVSNKEMPESLKGEADEWTINANVAVKIKN